MGRFHFERTDVIDDHSEENEGNLPYPLNRLMPNAPEEESIKVPTESQNHFSVEQLRIIESCRRSDVELAIVLS